MNFKKIRLGWFACVLPLLFPACREQVLEDRGDCPNWIFFEVSNAASFPEQEAVFLSASSAGGGLPIGETSVSRSALEEFGFQVQAVHSLRGYGLIGNGELWQEGSAWRSPLGADYVPLFRFAYEAALRGGEETVIPVAFRKEYMHVVLQFSGYDQARFPYEVVVRCNTVGIDAQTGAPLKGEFDYCPPQNRPGHFEFNLPRLFDRTLTLELVPLEESAEQSEHHARLNLYEVLQRSADLSSINLPDVSLEIDLAQRNIQITVSPWDEAQLEYEF